MKQKVHVLFKGTEDGYDSCLEIVVVLLQQPEKDFAALVKRFDEITVEKCGKYPRGIPSKLYDGDSREYEKEIKRFGDEYHARQECLTRHFGGVSRIDALLVWLQEEHGYVKVEFDTQNIDTEDL